MNAKTTAILMRVLIVVLLGLMAVLMFKPDLLDFERLVSHIRQPAQPAETVVVVLAAARDLDAGTLLDESMVQVVRVPQSQMPRTGREGLVGAAEIASVSYRYLQQPVKKGDLLYWRYLTRPPEPPATTQPEAATQPNEASRSDEHATVTVLVARGNLGAGAVLTAENTSKVLTLVALMPDEYASELFVGDACDAALGRALRAPVDAGQLIRRRRLLSDGEPGTKPPPPPPSYRLVALKVNRAACPADVRVGMMVDVVTRQPAADGGDRMLVVVSDAPVAAVNGDAVPGVREGESTSVSIKMGEKDAFLLEAFKATGYETILRTGPQPATRPDGESFGRFNPAAVQLLQSDGVSPRVVP
ncbi:MAG: hypothetical protein BIFFINMI_00755 [Phycisphaerae bacterium]|nr:hypothetical protein [Phycisphaerae bacterium]